MTNDERIDDFMSEEDVNQNEVENTEFTDETLSDGDNLSAGESEPSLEDKFNELNNSYLRLHADFDNYRKRTLKEKSELIKTAGEKVIVDLLPVLDDFERALDNIPVSDDNSSVKEGVELIYSKFVDFLLKNGVKKMDVIGETFDMEKHEALTAVPTDDEAMKGKIIDCVQQGYEMGEKVIRFPKVIVAK